MDVKEVLKIIKEKRENKGFTQAKAAVLSDFEVPLTYVNKEEEKTQFYFNELCRVFSLLDITLNITVKSNGELKIITNPTDKIFSDFIFSLRKNRKFTQAQLAKKLNSSTANYLYKENLKGNSQFTLIEVFKLSEVLDFHIDIF